MPRAQASITAVEAAVAVLLLLAISFVFVIGTPGETTPHAQTQLDTYADDATTILASEQPRHAEQTRLAEVAASEEQFDREAESLQQRLERILPSNVFYQLETEHGTIGHSLPDGVQTGTATVPTTHGDVTLRVWYP